MIYSQITTSYTDNAVFAFGSASVLFTLRYLRSGHLYDAILSFVAAGILLGTKFTGISVVAIILIATILKTLRLTEYSGLLKKAGLIICGMLILCTLGGRHYLLNTIEAGNPIYPFPLKILNHEMLEGSHKLQQVTEWVSAWEKEQGWNELNLWEKEYKRLLYTSRTAGPKFLFLLILALVSLSLRPQECSKEVWYLLAILWAVPIILFYANPSADFAKRAVWMRGSTRFLSFSIALFTIQGLIVIKKISKHFKQIYFFLVVLIAWDLLFINKTHNWEIALLYPLTALAIPLAVILCNFVMDKSKAFALKEEVRSISTRPFIVASTTNRSWITYALCFISLVGGLYFLQSYRDNTRYIYYQNHMDFEDFPRNFIDSWEFLDRANEKKTIALTIGWQPPGHKWFFYPLLGKHLQNDIVYISAKHKGEIPTWVDRGLLRGNSIEVWLHNIKRKKVDYIFVAEPWPIELSWIVHLQNKFQLVFSGNGCRIFKYTEKAA